MTAAQQLALSFGILLLCFGEARAQRVTESDVSKTEQTVAQQNLQLQQAREATHRAQAELSQLTTAVSKKTAEIDSLTKEIEAKKKQKDGTTEELQQLQDRLAEQQREKIDLENKAAAVEAQLSRKENLLKDVTKRLEQAQQQLAEHKTKLDALAAKGASQIADLIEIKVGGKVLVPNGESIGMLKDSEEDCKVSVAAKINSGKTLAEIGIQRIELLDRNNTPLPLGDGAIKLSARSFVITPSRLCERIRSVLVNEDPVFFRVSFTGAKGTPLVADYELKFRKRTLEPSLGMGLYFGGGDLASEDSRFEFAAFPALAGGIRLNAPIGDTNRDFYVDLKLVLGGGYVIVATETETAEETPEDMDTQRQVPENEVQRLAIFAGAALGLGKYLEVGYAYDVSNEVHMLLLTPSALTQSLIGR